MAESTDPESHWGDLIAEESLKFTVTFRDRKEYLGLWENRIWCTDNYTSKNYFEVAFAIRGQDEKTYPFILVLYHLWNHSYNRGSIFTTPGCRMLSNSSPKSKVQTSVLGLGVDFVSPLSQEQQEQQEQQQEPPPKSIKRGCTRGLKFDT